MDFDTNLEEELDDRPIEDRSRERPCLCCGKVFPSAGWGNRLCNDCKRRGRGPAV